MEDKCVLIFSYDAPLGCLKVVIHNLALQPLGLKFRMQLAVSLACHLRASSRCLCLHMNKRPYSLQRPCHSWAVSTVLCFVHLEITASFYSFLMPVICAAFLVVLIALKRVKTGVWRPHAGSVLSLFLSFHLFEGLRLQGWLVCPRVAFPFENHLHVPSGFPPPRHFRSSASTVSPTWKSTIDTMSNNCRGTCQQQCQATVDRVTSAPAAEVRSAVRLPPRSAAAAPIFFAAALPASPS